jgi:glutamate N-acetyltransferase / amino-acid N-acetyltransferase
MSTGVIGRRIKMEPYLKAIPIVAKNLEASAEAAWHAAVAATTTDLVSKSAALEAREIHPTH